MPALKKSKRTMLTVTSLGLTAIILLLTPQQASTTANSSIKQQRIN